MLHAEAQRGVKYSQFLPEDAAQPKQIVHGGIDGLLSHLDLVVLLTMEHMTVHAALDELIR